MIRVTIELVPHGIEDRKSHLGTVIIANDGSGTKSVGNYRARLSRRGEPDSTWRTATVECFPRARLGAFDLLFRALRDAVGGRNP